MRLMFSLVVLLLISAPAMAQMSNAELNSWEQQTAYSVGQAAAANAELEYPLQRNQAAAQPQYVRCPHCGALVSAPVRQPFFAPRAGVNSDAEAVQKAAYWRRVAAYNARATRAVEQRNVLWANTPIGRWFGMRPLP